MRGRRRVSSGRVCKVLIENRNQYYHVIYVQRLIAGNWQETGRAGGGANPGRES